MQQIKFMFFNKATKNLDNCDSVQDQKSFREVQKILKTLDDLKIFTNNLQKKLLEEFAEKKN